MPGVRQCCALICRDAMFPILRLAMRTPIVAGDYLFMVNDGGILTCVVAQTGAIAWQQRVPGAYSASPVLAGGLIYVASEEGVTTVVRPGATYERVAVNQLDSGILASIAVAHRSLFIRTEDDLYRIAMTR